MNANAFRDIWARVMFFKFLKLHEPQFYKRKEENATITLLWTRNSVMASKLLAYFIRAAISTTATKKSKPKIVLSFTTKQNVLFKLKAQKSRIGPYNVLMLSSLANEKRDTLLSIL